MAKLYNLARMTTATTGTGTITLGSAVTGWLTFTQAGISTGEMVTYAIEDGNNREIGRGVYTAAGTTLTRSVLRSTNANNPISLSGSAQVFITAAKEDIANLGEENTFSAFEQRLIWVDDAAGPGPSLYLVRDSASPAVNDSLGILLFSGKDSAGNIDDYASIVADILDPTSTSEDAKLRFRTVRAGSLANRLVIENGLYMVGATGGDMGAGTINATALYHNGTAIPTLAHGTYTPTTTNVTNVASSAGSTGAGYFRVGDMVTVQGAVSIDPTSASVATELGISLPIASSFTVARQLVGSAGNLAGSNFATITADTVNARASLQYLPSTNANHNMFFNFTYRVL